MKMTNRALSLLIAWLLLCGMLPHAAIAESLEMASETDASAFAYTITDGEVTITEYIGYAAEVVIPSTIDGCPVTTIGAYAFAWSDSLTSVTIPASVKRMHWNVFQDCTNLKNIYCEAAEKPVTWDGFWLEACDATVWFDGILSIGQVGDYRISVTKGTVGIVEYLGEDTEVVIPASVNGLPVTSIEHYAFAWQDDVTSVVIPYGVTRIGFQSFESMDALTSVFIPNSVASIEYCAFGSCTSLESVSIPASVREIDNNVFESCLLLKNIYCEASEQPAGWNEKWLEYCYADVHWGVDLGYPEQPEEQPEEEPDRTDSDPSSFVYEVADGKATVTGYDGSAGALLIPSELGGCPVAAIGNRAFYARNDFVSVVIPDTVTSIGDNAFSDCTSLESAVLSDSVTVLGTGVFWGCTSLANVTLSACLTEIPHSTFGGCTALKSIAIPDGVTMLGFAAFQDCTALESVELSESLETIDGQAFCNCASLAGIVMPRLVKSIGSNAFSNCVSLESVVFSEELQTIGINAFCRCRSLKAIELPKNVSEIRSGAFAQCPALERIEADAENPYYYSDGNCLIESETDRLILGCRSSVIPSGVKVIGENSFAGAPERLVIPEGVEAIEKEAFVWCRGMAEAVLPASLTEIGDSAFYNSSLLSVSIPAGVVKIGSEAFVACQFLSSIHVESDNAFFYSQNNCLIERASMTLLAAGYGGVIPQGVVHIGNRAFVLRGEIEEVIIPDSVTTIGYGAFDYSSVKRVYIPAGVVEIGALAFDRCSDLTDIYCEAESMPKNWAYNWLGYTDSAIHWGETKPEGLFGDMDGDGAVDSKDVTHLMRYFAYMDYSTGISDVEISAGADCNGDGVIDGRDCVRLLRYLANFDPVTGESSVELG